MITEQDIKQWGLELHLMTETLGWKRFTEMMERHKQEIGLLSLRDDEKPKEYYQGRLEAIEALQAEVEHLALYAKRTIEAEEEAEERTSSEVLSAMGGGSLA